MYYIHNLVNQVFSFLISYILLPTITPHFQSMRFGKDQQYQIINMLEFQEHKDSKISEIKVMSGVKLETATKKLIKQNLTNKDEPL